ncbi:MAG: UPF0158 family protein [Betaproteobacteria bacterium]|nr:UPF0158 family protein [Betaproteobacteria bacterium]
MEKLDLNAVAEKFEEIATGMHLFYNTETGEFDFYSDFMEEEEEEVDREKFEDDSWVAAPSQWEINEYDIMTDYTETISDSHKNRCLCIALDGKGAFRRFKDMLHHLDLIDEWYIFKRKAYIEIAREWCEENGIEYLDNAKK